MKEVTLYGQGAVTLHDGKNIIRSNDGSITVPEHLVARVEALGFSRTVRGAPEVIDAVRDAIAGSAFSEIPNSDAPPAIPPGETPDEKVARYRAEIEARGYKGDAVDTILAERLRFDELVASGKTDEEAAAIVWGGHDPKEDLQEGMGIVDGEKVEEKASTDVGALSADVNEDDVAKKVD